MPLYKDGKRRILPPLRFGWGVLLHLLRHGRSYDIVHTASFPYFSLLAAGLARWFGGYRIVCDWHEVWSDDYWRDYLGKMGRAGSFVQRLCARIPQKAYAFSRLHAERLKSLGLEQVGLLTGEYASPGKLQSFSGSSVTVVYAGRFIPEKRIGLLVDALALARSSIPGLRARLIGDGPTRPEMIARVEALGLSDMVDLPGFVTVEAVDTAMRESLCIVQPSSREGYGMVVIEAAHRGVPAIVVAAPDNAATELVDEGVNGFVVPEPNPSLLAEAIVECWNRGPELRASTRRWYDENEFRLSIESSLQTVVESYANAPGGRSVPPSQRAEAFN
jgi:glycosyltransferase involved in cell wall biosynthesis